jgi:hypothetical protein
MNLRDVLVIQRGKDFGFALKAGETLLVRGERLGQNFDCD